LGVHVGARLHTAPEEAKELLEAASEAVQREERE